MKNIEKTGSACWGREIISAVEENVDKSMKADNARNSMTKGQTESCVRETINI